MGAHKIRETESTQVRKTSYDFATHEDWDPNNIENDICWIKLPETVELGKLPNLLAKVYWNLCSKDPSTIEIHETQNMRYLCILEF